MLFHLMTLSFLRQCRRKLEKVLLLKGNILQYFLKRSLVHHVEVDVPTKEVSCPHSFVSSAVNNVIVERFYETALEA